MSATETTRPPVPIDAKTLDRETLRYICHRSKIVLDPERRIGSPEELAALQDAAQHCFNREYEDARKQRVKDLNRPIEAEQNARLRATIKISQDDDGEEVYELACPCCGSTNIDYEETTFNWRHGLHSFDGKTVVWNSQDRFSDSCIDEHFDCEDCHAEMDLPDGVDLDWV